MKIEIELDSGVGPRVLYPKDAEAEEVEAAVPAGWRVDWQTGAVAVYGGEYRSSPLVAAPRARAETIGGVRLRRAGPGVYETPEGDYRLERNGLSWRVLERGVHVDDAESKAAAAEMIRRSRLTPEGRRDELAKRRAAVAAVPDGTKLPKDPSVMRAGEINKELDALDRRSTANADAFIAAGRGHERPSEYLAKSDPLSREALAIFERRADLRAEIERRYGPRAPSRLPPRTRRVSV